MRKQIGGGRWRRTGVVLGVVALFATPVEAVAQLSSPVDVRAEAFAGGEIEEYLRVLQGAGAANWYPWSVRAFSPAEVEHMVKEGSAHPWEDRYRFGPATDGEIQMGWIRPRAGMIFNTAFPQGGNDGAVWAGRGLTSVVEGGAWVRFGPLSLVAAPVLFRAENMDFDLARRAGGGDPGFGDARAGGTGIDLPQRFGNGAYSRISPGQSTLRLDLGPLALAASTANQYWGPATDHPLLLGNNADGFPHLLLGTSRPLNLGFGLVHGRLVWGRLEQSAYSPMADPDALRFMSGLVGVLRPRGLPGLELGAGRFFHSPWPEGGPTFDNFTKPLEGFLKVGLAGDDDDGSDIDNQLASVFGRWLVPNTGLEVYAEYAREDHSWNMRDFILEPDHDAAYLFGARRVWAGDSEGWTVVRGEVMNAEISHLYRVRPQTRFYRHFGMRQGHTVYGQILGSAHGFGGAATELAVDRYEPWGRWTVGWSRAVYDRAGRYRTTGIVQEERVDTSHSLGAELLWFRGPLELLAGLEGSYRFNRNLQDDAVNVHAELGVGWRP